MKPVTAQDLDRERFAPLYETLPQMVSRKQQEKVVKEFAKEPQPVLVGMLNNSIVTHAYYKDAAQSLGNCGSCGARLHTKAYDIRDTKGTIDNESRTITICPDCLKGLPTEKDRVTLFEWLLFDKPESVFTAQMLGIYLSCEPWRSPLFMDGLLAAGENIEALPPCADSGPVIRPQRRCDHPDQRFARGLMRRVFFDFHFGITGNYGMEGMDRLKSMNEDSYYNRQMSQSPSQPDVEMICLLKRTILSQAPITLKTK